MLELTAGALGQGVGGHDTGGSGGPVVHGQVVEGCLQGAFDFFHRQRLADDTRGERQHGAFVDANQLGQAGAGARRILQARLAGTGVGVTGIGQQVANSALHALFGKDHRSRAKGVLGEHARHVRAFGATHDDHILAPRAFDARRSDAEFKTGYRVQRWQRTKTNSHESAPREGSSPYSTIRRLRWKNAATARGRSRRGVHTAVSASVHSVS
ncbi:hypothetical protein D3C80_1262580 [compost metagenome]